MVEKKGVCSGKIEIDGETGEFKIRHMTKNCKAILKKVNPVRGTFWKNHMSDEEKKKLKITD